MNLLQLIIQNNYILFNHPRIEIDHFISLFFFENSMKENDMSTLMYVDNTKYLDKLFEDDMSNCILFDDDNLTEVDPESLIIFPSVEKYNQYVSTHNNFEEVINNLKHKLIICNSIPDEENKVIQREEIKFKNVLFKTNYFDKIIPIICYNCSKYDKLTQMKILYDGDVFNGEFNYNSEVIHFIEIPEMDTLRKMRSLLTNSYTCMFFYIKYEDDGLMSSDVEAYNNLMSNFEECTNKFKHDLIAKYNKNNIIFEQCL